MTTDELVIDERYSLGKLGNLRPCRILVYGDCGDRGECKMGFCIIPDDQSLDDFLSEFDTNWRTVFTVLDIREVYALCKADEPNRSQISERR